MTILKEILTFDRPARTEVCRSCSGKGKIEIPKGMSGPTAIFIIIFIGFYVVTLMSAGGGSLVSLITLVISTPIALLIMKEYKEQTKYSNNKPSRKVNSY